MTHQHRRPRRIWCASTALVLGFLTACSDNGFSVFDRTAPPPIADLAVTDSLGTTITLAWTASGDDNAAGAAAEYDVRRSLQPITDANWADASPVAGAPTPATSGTAQGLTVNDLAWWTKYYFAIRVRDGAGNWSALSNVAAGSPYPEPGLRFLVRTHQSILAIDMEGNVEPFYSVGFPLDVLGNRVYVMGNSAIAEFDVYGSWLRSIPIPDSTPWSVGFAALPGGRFAVMNNDKDSVYFVDSSGVLVAATGMIVSPNAALQNLAGVVVGDSLVISEDGSNHLLVADLNTYAIKVFYNLSNLSGWLGAIDYRDGDYFLCQAQTVYRFDAARTQWRTIATLGTDLYNIVDIVVAGGHSFVTLNFAGAIYRINNETGSVVRFIDGLDYPEDLELIAR